VRAYAAIFEVDGRRVPSYAIVAATREAALATLDGWLWPEGADRLRILDEDGREALAVERPIGGAK